MDKILNFYHAVICNSNLYALCILKEQIKSDLIQKAVPMVSAKHNFSVRRSFVDFHGNRDGFTLHAAGADCTEGINRAVCLIGNGNGIRIFLPFAVAGLVHKFCIAKCGRGIGNGERYIAVCPLIRGIAVGIQRYHRLCLI